VTDSPNSLRQGDRGKDVQVSANAKRFFLRAFGCEGFAAKRRVLCEVERESAWQARLRDGHVRPNPARCGFAG